jgi:hypothetical protein
MNSSSSSKGSRYRSKAVANRVIGLSISYQRENLLARGLGLEHLRELLIRLARPLLRQGASVAYGGHWRDTEDNFTYDLLRLISAEQEDNSLGGPDTGLAIGRLYNHSPWPSYLDITPRIEAQWINCCRIVRITQKHARIADSDTVSDSEARNGSDRALFNAAVVLSAMRRLSMEGMSIDIPDLPSPETIPSIMARVILGGKVDGFSGFLPGIFEEALVTLERQVPLYVLGGFGGAAEVLAKALIDPAAGRPEQFTVDWQKSRTPNVTKLQQSLANFGLPAGIRTTEDGLGLLFRFVEKARLNLAATLNVGLDETETRELLTTRDMSKAVQLVRKGLDAKIGLKSLPA